MWRKDIEYLFPIRSQTSPNDRYWLMKLIEQVRGRNRAYRYVEVGSYVGGTLTPALLDESCSEVLSIDLRPTLQADARNTQLDYSQTSTATMLAELQSHGFADLAKLTTFDGRANECDFKGRKYDLAFIDAEHTDEAVFRDFLSIYDHLENSAICGFHDTNLVTVGMDNILTFLRYQRRKFWFGMFRHSAVSAICFNMADGQAPRDFLEHVWDWSEFKNQARDQLLLDSVQNRLALTFALKDRPVMPM